MITPELIAKPGTEHAHQCALFCWLSRYHATNPETKLIFAIPNGGERNMIVAAKMKAEGVKRGVSDIFIPLGKHGYHGFFLELKKIGGKESKEQQEFGAEITKHGYLYACIQGWESAASAISWYLSLNKPL